MPGMIYFWAVILAGVNLFWLATTAIGLPGNWLMLICAGLLAWAYWPEPFSVWTLVAAAVIATLAEVVEFVAGMFGASWAGAGKAGSFGALAGGLLGGVVGTFAIPIPLIGSLIGAVVGAGLGAGGLELAAGRSSHASLRSGVGSGIGRLLGTLLKLAAGAVIWVVLTVASFWP